MTLTNKVKLASQKKTIITRICFSNMKYILPIIGLIVLVSCKREFISVEVKVLYESVMKVHDEIMPEMSTISKLKRRLKKSGVTSDESMSLRKQLEDADEGMMSWMADFKLNRKASEETQLRYLQAEQPKIDKVSRDMKSAIAAAEAYLNSITK